MAQKRENRANLFRLQILIIDGGLLALRNKIDQTLTAQGITLSACLNNERTTINGLKSRGIITQIQYDQLFPTSAQVPTTSDMDITLIICLLRNLKCFGLNKKFDWNATPISADITIEADICRLKAYRNKISHIAETTAIQANDFVTWWTDIEKILVRLSSPALNIQQTIAGFKVCPLDPEEEKRVEEEMEKWKDQEADVDRLKTEMTEVKNEMSEVKNEMSEVENEMSDVKNEMSEVKNEMSDVNNELTEVKNEISDVNNEMTEVKNEMSYVKNVMSDVNNEMSDVNNEMIVVKNEISDVDNEMTEVTNEMSYVKNDMTEVKNEMSDVKNEMTEVKNEMTDVKNEMTDVKKKVGEVEKTQEEIKRLRRDEGVSSTLTEEEKYQKRKKELKDGLIEFYKTRHSNVFLSPLFEENDTPLASFYIRPALNFKSGI